MNLANYLGKEAKEEPFLDNSKFKRLNISALGILNFNSRISTIGWL